MKSQNSNSRARGPILLLGITVYTLATVDEVSGSAGNFSVRLKIKPRYVTGTHVLDESIVEKLTSERPEDFNMEMGKTKALYRSVDF